MLTTKLIERGILIISLVATVAAGCKDDPVKPPGGTGGTGGATGGSGGATGGTGGAAGGTGGTGVDASADVSSDGADGASVDGADTGTTTDGTSDGADATTTDATTDVFVGDGGAASMTFFVTSTGSGALGGNLGGLIGADARCEALAVAVGAGGKGWKAYLSTTASGGAAAVNAKDRIGAGPWRNQRGQMVAANVTALLAGPAANLMIDERGAAVPIDWHEVLTGTQIDGTVYANRTCDNWTSMSGTVQAQVGIATDADPTQRFSSHPSGCSQMALLDSGNQGRLYCFASTP